jgi:hypothetical protein
MAELQPFQITRSQHELMLKRERPPMKSGAQLASAYSPLLNRCRASLTSAGVSAMCAPRSDSLCGVSIGCALITPTQRKLSDRAPKSLEVTEWNHSFYAVCDHWPSRRAELITLSRGAPSVLRRSESF